MLAIIRRTIGTILCFPVPLFAVVALALWDESRQEFGMLIAIVRRVTGELGISADVELKILGPAIAIATFVFIWFLAGKRTRRATWMIVGLNSFAIIFVGLVVIGQ